jgi:hypothetical protein
MNLDGNTIQQIKQANDLSKIVEDTGIQIKNGRGECPFCETKSSNVLSVNSDFFNCFHCGESGDVLKFIMLRDNIDFIHAVKKLAERANMSEVLEDKNITESSGIEPKAAAKVYLEKRGLNVPESWYTQETFGRGNNQSATIRFAVGIYAAGVTCYWERIIDAHLFDRKANFKGSYKGESWQPPGQRICKGDRVHIVEGIFDAIALQNSMQLKVVSAMSCGNFPQRLFEKYKGKGLTWCLMLDYGDAGAFFSKKWAKKIKDEGEHVEVYYPDSRKDWNDLQKSNALNDELLDRYWWRGQFLISDSVAEKMAWNFINNKVNQKYSITKNIITFGNCYFKCEIINYKKDNKINVDSLIEEKDFFKAVALLKQMVSSKRISTATAKLLYTEFDSIQESYSYFFNVNTTHFQKPKMIVFDAAMVSDSKSFSLALLKKVGQCSFTGNNNDLQHITNAWFKQQKPVVETIRHMGYSPTHSAYIFQDFGYKDGRKFEANKYNYLQFGGSNVKTNFNGWEIPKPVQQLSWFNDLYLSGGNNALTALAFWTLSLFANQVRNKNNQGTIPFLELTGIAHSGKSTIIEFLWKLVGRDGYEGEDPEKHTRASLGRYFMQCSNLPAVLLEGDRENASLFRKNFSIDHIKTLFRGQSPYGRGVKNSGIEIDNVPFLGTLVISQNQQIEGEAQILGRIVQCVANKKGFNPQGLSASNRLKQLNSEQVISFMHNALSKERKLMQTYARYFDIYKNQLIATNQIADIRIVESHAQIMAFGRCLQLLVIEFDNARLDAWIAFMTKLAINRQIKCQSEHLLVERFWEIYETFNESTGTNDPSTLEPKPELNHARTNDEVAINLNLFKKFASENRQDIDISLLKNLLINSKKYKYIEQKKINSAILGKTLHCWIFKKPKELTK